MRPLWRLLAKGTEYYPIIFVYSVCISVLTLATPISVQSLVNTFTFGPYWQPIFILSLILLGILFILGTVKCLQYLLVEYLQRKFYAMVTASIGRAYFIGDENDDRVIDNKENRYFDVVIIHKNLAFLVTDAVAIIFQTCLGLVLISLYHPYFIILSFIILLATVTPLFIFGREAMLSAIEESTGKYEVADHIKALATHEGRQRSYQEKLAEIDDKIQLFLQKRSRHFRCLFAQNILYIIFYAVLNALLLAMGGLLVIKNQLSVGQLVAAEIVVNAILSHFLYAKKYLESFYDMYASIVKVHIFYDYIDKYKMKTSSQEPGHSPLFGQTSISYHQGFKSVKSVYSPRNYRKFVRNFLIAVVVITALLAVTPWQQFSSGQGQILAFNPNDRVQTITATLGGVVEEWLVRDGQFIKKGEPIVRVVDNDPNYLVRLEAKRDAAVAEFEAARVASDTGRLNYHRQEKLVAEGLSSPKEFEQAKITYQKLRAEEAAAAANLAKAEVDLSRQQQQVITAPRDGQILRILLGSGTTNVKSGDALVEFVPQTSENAVELFIDGNDLPLIFVGRKVRLQFEGWPAIQFSGWPAIAVGSFGGVVAVVDPSVAANGTFRILVNPDPEDPVPWPEQHILRQGTRAVGIVVLDQVSAGYELWRQINGFPKSMPQAPEQFKPGGGEK